MIKISTTLLLFSIPLCGFSQQIGYLQPLSSDAANVCSGESVRFQTRIQNASYFEFQSFDDDQEKWITVSSGNPETGTGIAEHVFHSSSSLTVRVLASNSSESLYSNTHSVQVHKPSFNIQPTALTQCNGGNVTFRSSSETAQTYQWQISTNGGASFSDLIADTKYHDIGTANLTISEIINTFHNHVFRCVVSDSYGCEEYSEPAPLNVNQLSTAISPTLATQFCEGDTARFFIGNNVGEALSYQWQIRNSGQTVYSNLTETDKFEGTDTPELKVQGILPYENNYRLRVSYKNLLQNPLGETETSACILQSTRTNYVVHPRPEKPSPIDTLSSCGPDVFIITAPENYYWYKDTLGTPIKTDANFYETAEVESTTRFFFSRKDSRSCESHKQEIITQIHTIPSQLFEMQESICPDINTISLKVNNRYGEPVKLNIESSDFPLFGNLNDFPLAEEIIVPLPNEKSSGKYHFNISTKNEFCISETKILSLNVLKPTSISSVFSDLEVCENEEFRIEGSYDGELPINFEWLKEGISLPEHTKSYFAVPAAKYADAATYAWKVNGYCGTATSNNFKINILPNTEIILQPQDQSVCENNSAVFRIKAEGSGELHYQWYINDEETGINVDSLILENVNLTRQNSRILCKITSDCKTAIYSDTVILNVVQLPSTPLISDTLVFCTSATKVELTSTALPDHQLQWFNENRTEIDSEINLNLARGKIHYVSQSDINGCKSLLQPFMVESAPAFPISLVSNVSGLCHSGLFNRSGSLITFTPGTSAESTTFELFRNSVFQSSNLTGQFEISTGGFYTVQASRGFCISTDSLKINSISEDLLSGPSAGDINSCPGESLILTATSSFTDGNYYWWQHSNQNTGLATGQNFNPSNIISDTLFYVSYGRETNGIFCESPRSPAKITLGHSLKFSLDITQTDCTSSGAVMAEVSSGVPPFVFTLNDTTQNTSGSFTGLQSGIHRLQVEDSQGCRSDTSFTINSSKSPVFTQLLSDARVCSGNIANFNFSGADYTIILWEKKLPGESEFSILQGENTQNLRITNSGNVVNPNGTLYRASLLNGDCTPVRSEAKLLVNSISGTNPSQRVCEGDSVQFTLDSYQITGNVKNYQWQYRVGTSGGFSDLDSQINTTFSIPQTASFDAGYYRNRITFDNGNGNTCVINSSTNGMRLIVNSGLPMPVISSSDTICLGGSKTLEISNCTGTVLWSDSSTGFTKVVSPLETTEYSATCTVSGCSAISEPILIVVRNEEITQPKISYSKTSFCFGDSIDLSVENCLGQVNWSDGSSGNTFSIVAETSFAISAICSTGDCQSPPSDTIQVSVSPQLIAGTIAENPGEYCAGYNSPNISSTQNPNTTNIQWQYSGNCNDSLWTDIPNANGLAFNPDVLQTTACYRRKVWNSCDTLYSNVTVIQVNPDPIVIIEANTNSVCENEDLILSHNLLGGAGNCPVQWQINKISASATNANWTNLAVGDSLKYSSHNTGGDSTFHFRARVNCDVSSCNLATSNTISILFKAQLLLTSNLADTTVCAGSSLVLQAQCSGGNIRWSNGSTLNQISIQPIESTSLSVSCGNECKILTDSVNISITDGISKPIISSIKTSFCFGDSIDLSVENCLGQVNWSDGSSGNTFSIVAETSFAISAICSTGDCQSPPSDTIQVSVSPQLIAGTIAENPGEYCAGYNSPNISSTQNPNTTNIQWQYSGNCNDSLWTDIPNANGLAFNPDVLQTTACYRRKVWNSCDTLYSNVTVIQVNPDPIVIIEANTNSVCENEDLILSHNLLGGAGNCPVQWQINKISASATNANWTNLAVGDSLKYSSHNTGGDSTFHFRARVNCDVSSCNLATSNTISILFKAQLLLTSNLADTTVCAGSSLVLQAQCSGGNIRWSNGSTLNQISIQPIESTSLSVSCGNECNQINKTIDIQVTEGISPPISTTPDSLFTPEVLRFSALGQNILWYISPLSTTPLDSAPVISKAGTYTFWLSQITGTCESPRIAITASLLATIRIVSQTQEMANCYGNVSNLTVAAEGTGSLKYKWQRKLPDESLFSDIEGSNFLSNTTTATLRIASTGNAHSPAGSIFRCVVTDDFGEFISAEIPLTVNRIQGSLPNANLCVDENLALDLNRTHIVTGNPLQIQWQHRPGTGSTWLPLSDTGNVSGSNSLQLSINMLPEMDQIQFRCSITFSSNSGSCAETSDLMTLKVGKYPEPPRGFGDQICEGQRLTRFTLYPPDGLRVVWYKLHDNTPLRTQPAIDTKVPGDHFLEYSYSTNLGCESSKARVHVIVHPLPATPINTTPEVYDESPSLTFSAIGENLKWYRTKTLRAFEEYPPTFTTTGRKSYYVTQTNENGCESERLQIISQMRAVFSITTQPVSQSNCDGNTVTFGVRIRGGENPTYQWQINYYGNYIDLPGQTSRDLRIPDAGMAPYVHNSQYRCIIRSQGKELISNTVDLKVNYLKTSLPEINICEGEKLSFEKFKDSLSGNINKIEWQRRIGSSYSTVFEAGALDEFYIPDSASSGSYRFRVTFRNLAGGTCVRNSNIVRMTHHSLPKLPTLDSISACEGETILNFMKKLPAHTNILNWDSSAIDPYHLLSKANPPVFLINTYNSFGCNTPYQTVSPTILTAPRFTGIDTLISLCRFSEVSSGFRLLNNNTLWFLPEDTEAFSENELPLETSNSYSQLYHYKIQGENGCYSSRGQLTVQISSCYFRGDADTCIKKETTNMNRNEWNYFFKKGGEIYGSVHPNSLNTGRTSLDVLSTNSSFFDDKNQNSFYARQWTLMTSRELPAPVKIRLYMSLDEIKKYGKSPADAVTILRKNINQVECEWKTESSEYTLIAQDEWKEADIDNYFYVEFETNKNGHFLIWQNLFPTGILHLRLSSQMLPVVSVEEYNQLPFGNYNIQKSADGIMWTEWKNNIIASESLTDNRPYIFGNHYQLSYDFNNGIKAYLDTKSVEVPENLSECSILNNPGTERSRISVFFPNADKNKIQLMNISGNVIPLQQVTDAQDYFEIRPVNPLSRGMYILKMENSFHAGCVKKVLIY